MSKSSASRRRRGSADEQTPWYASRIDPDLVRLQEELEAIETERVRAEREAVGEPVDDGTEPSTDPETASPPPRTIEERLIDLERRVISAEAAARSAEVRARAAAARAEDILFALPDLAHELRLFLDEDEPGAERLIEAIERMRTRVTSSLAARSTDPADPDERVIVLPD